MVRFKFIMNITRCTNPLLRSITIALLLYATLFCTSITLSAESVPTEVKHNLLQGNFKAAAQQLEGLASQDNFYAKYQLSLLYLSGRGVVKSTKRAEALLIESATRLPEAAYVLGSLYFKGKQLPKNLKSATYYLTIAATNNNKKALRLLSKIKSKTRSQRTISPELQDQLNGLIRQGELTKLQSLYSKGLVLNGSFDDGDTALILAIKLNKLAIANWLIEQDVDLNAKDTKGNTALHYAVSNKKLDSVQLLTKKYSNINSLNINQQTPLMIAIDLKFYSGINWLVNQGANVPRSYKNNLLKKKQINHQVELLNQLKSDASSLYFNWPIVAIAVAQNQQETAKRLVLDGNSPWQRTPNNLFALSICLNKGFVELAKLMLKQYPVSEQTSQRLIEDYFKSTVQLGEVDLIKSALNRGQQLNSNNLVASGIKVAIENERFSALDYFLPLIKERPDTSLLMMSISKNNLPLTKRLLEAGTDLGSKDPQGFTPLIKAIQLNHAELIALLLNNQADFDQTDNAGLTPLMWAAKKNCYSCAEDLVNQGANLELTSSLGNTALMYSAQGSNKTLQILLAQDPNISTRNNLSYTALMLAVQSGCYDCTQSLLAKDARPQRKTQTGQDSFDLASNKPNILKLLNEN